MKDIIEILKSKGIDLSDEQSSEIKKEVAENYRTINDYNRQKEKLDLAKENEEKTKKAFEDFKKEYEGVDAKELNEKIRSLSEDIQTQQNDYEKKIAEMSLNSMLSDIAQEMGCKDYELAQKMIDYDSLLSSKNQKEDIEKQFATLKEQKPILFEDESKQSKKGDIIFSSGGDDKISDEERELREVMGLDTKGEDVK